MKQKLKEQHKTLSAIPEFLQSKRSTEIGIDLELNSGFYVVGVGKASVKMAMSLTKQFSGQIIDGILIAGEPVYFSDHIQVFEGSHPIPDSNTVAASYEVLDFAKKLPVGETLIFCISGGASSMFCIPPFGIETDELQELYRLLLNSGASIHEMNVVRKHVCDLKGGKFGEELHHLNLITLIESDVPGNNLSTIGSGPTIADSSTYQEAIEILKQYGVWNKVPISIQEHLIGGMEGYIPENPKFEKEVHPDQKIELLSGFESVKRNIIKFLEEKDYEVWIDTEAYSGDVRSVAKRICSKAISVVSGNEELKKPCALIYNGESEVKVKPNGKGGRNQELALIAAISLEGQHSISMLSMDTDGIDGPTDAAGAIISSKTTLDARKQKIDPEKLLSQSNAFKFHELAGTHLKTGPTGVNYMDLQVVLID